MEIGRSPAGGGGGRGGGGGGGGGGDRHIPFPRKKGEQIGPFVFFPPPPFFLAEKLEKGGEGGVSLWEEERDFQLGKWKGLLWNNAV